MFALGLVVFFGGAADAAEVQQAPLDVRLGAWLGGAVDRGALALSVLIAFAAGIVVSLSPCVYPLIPITVAVFGAREEQSYLRSFALSLCYVAGMALFYSAAAVTFSLLGLASGSLMAMPVVVLSIAGLGAVMAASLLGAFELVIPASWQTRLSSIGGTGFKGAFLMGLVAGVIAAPCAGPVLVFILALIAKEGSILLGVALMLAYALGIGLLFLILGTFSQLIARMPKSGGWMEIARSVLGLGMLCAALYIALPHLGPVKDILSLAWSPAPLATAAVLILAGLAAGALHKSFHDGSLLEGWRKLVGVLMCTLGLMALVLSTELPAANADESAAAIAWRDDHDAALALARTENRPVVIDFGAEWCVACKELDKHSFSDPQVQAEATRFVAVKIDCTELTDEVSALWKRYGIRGLPNVVFIDSVGRALDEPRVTTFLPPAQLLAEMQKVR